MKITDVRTILLTGPCTDDPFLSEARKRRSAAFIEIRTDTELVGLGETYAGYFCPELVPGTVAFFAPILIGQTVDNIAELWARMYRCENFWCRVGLGSIVLSGIEAALWDLKGKACGLPVHALLGGRKHDRLLCYATGGPSNYPKDRLGAKLDFYRSLGFRAVKLGAGSYSAAEGSFMAKGRSAAAEFEADKLEFVRRHAGPDLTVALDGHMGNGPYDPWDVETARGVLAAVAPYDLLFFEEPLHYTNVAGYSELSRNAPVPVAGGECMSATCEWQVFVDLDCFNIGQPDAGFVGGLGEFMKIAAMLEGRGRKLATHSWGAGGVFMQNLHCGFAAGNTVVLEIAPAYGPLHREVIGDSFAMLDGMALPPEAPGLGIVLTEHTKNRYPFVPGSGEFNSVPGKVLVD